jgi:hypothetical protein
VSRLGAHADARAAFARVRSPGRSRFTRSPQKMTGRARRAFVENGPGHKLMDALGSAAYFFTLTPKDLGLSVSDDASGLYNDTVSTLLDAVARAFNGPVFAVVEVGKGSAPGVRGRLHVQLIAHRDDGPAHVPRDTKRCKPVYDIFGLYRYLHKPPEPGSLAAELDAAAARVLSSSGRLPNTRKHLLSAERLEWSRSLIDLEPNIATAPPETPKTEPAATQPEPRPSDQPTAVLNPQSLPSKTLMSSERSGGDAPERSVGKTRRRPRPVPVHATPDRRQSPRRAPRPRARARAPPRPPRRRPHHRPFDRSERRSK